MYVVVKLTEILCICIHKTTYRCIFPCGFIPLLLTLTLLSYTPITHLRLYRPHTLPTHSPFPHTSLIQSHHGSVPYKVQGTRLDVAFTDSITTDFCDFYPMYICHNQSTVFISITTKELISTFNTVFISITTKKTNFYFDWYTYTLTDILILNIHI